MMGKIERVELAFRSGLRMPFAPEHTEQYYSYGSRQAFRGAREREKVL